MVLPMGTKCLRRMLQTRPPLTTAILSHLFVLRFSYTFWWVLLMQMLPFLFAFSFINTFFFWDCWLYSLVATYKLRKTPGQATMTIPLPGLKLVPIPHHETTMQLTCKPQTRTGENNRTVLVWQLAVSSVKTNSPVCVLRSYCNYFCPQWPFSYDTVGCRG